MVRSGTTTNYTIYRYTSAYNFHWYKFWLRYICQIFAPSTFLNQWHVSNISYLLAESHVPCSSGSFVITMKPKPKLKIYHGRHLAVLQSKKKALTKVAQPVFRRPITTQNSRTYIKWCPTVASTSEKFTWTPTTLSSGIMIIYSSFASYLMGQTPGRQCVSQLFNREALNKRNNAESRCWNFFQIKNTGKKRNLYHPLTQTGFTY
jgi:hypothetical protein